jgi:hypothetical protein
MKKIVVTSLNWKEIVEVDDSIFDDYKVEACTQAMERAIRSITNIYRKYRRNIYCYKQ